jgi:hypothetical protein
MFEVEKNIPVPAAKTGTQRYRAKYPFADMGVGDSFFVPVTYTSTASEMTRRLNSAIGCAHSAARTFKRRTGRDDFAITCRSTIDPHGDTGVRVWRIRELTKQAD